MATTLRQLIANIDKNGKTKTDPDWEELAQACNIDYLHYSNDTRLKAYWIKVWYCTDTWVGIAAYFLDDEFVCLSNQTGRKCGIDFKFVSEDAYYKVEKYLRSLVEVDTDVQIPLIGDLLDEELEDTYTVEYNTQILQNTAIYNGEVVTITKKKYDWEDKDKYFHTVEIKDKSGKKKEVDCRELKIPYNTI